MHSLSMLGVLIAGIGGFIFVSNWDTRRGGRRRMIDLLVFILVGAGIALFVVGIFQ
jgi:glucose uptake protein GlcU